MIRPNSRETALLCGPQGQRRRMSDWPAKTPEEARSALAPWETPVVFGATLFSIKLGGLPAVSLAWHWLSPMDHSKGRLWIACLGNGREFLWRRGTPVRASWMPPRRKVVAS